MNNAVKRLRTLHYLAGFSFIACTAENSSSVAARHKGGEPKAESRSLANRVVSKTTDDEKNLVYDTIDLGILDVGSGAPADSNVARSVYDSDRVISGSSCPKGVDMEVCENERDHTLEWLRSFLPINPNDHPPSGGGLPAFRERVMLVPSIQERDDGAFVTYSRNGFLLEYVDARIMSVLIRGSAVRAMSLEDAYWRFASSGRCHVRRMTTQSESSSPSDVWGRLEVLEHGRCPVGPVEWFRADDLILFVVEKRRQPPQARHGRLLSANPSTIIGGIPYNDEREFRRFEKPNRKALSSEYLLGLKRKSPERAPTDRTQPGVLHGRMDGTAPVQAISNPKKIEALRRILEQRRLNAPDTAD